jgi:GTP-binding protein EngB required for normal cell division
MMSKIEELQKYAELEGTEVGDYLSRLCELESFIYYCAHSNFAQAYDKEVEHQLNYMKMNTKMVTTKMTREIETIELKWIDD